MPRKKQAKLDEVKILPNVFLSSNENVMDSVKDYFKGKNKFTLELGCGNGEYTIALAEKYPDRSFIGVDRKGNRIWMGSKISLEKNLPNCAFLITCVDQINELFDENSVEEIWITFPDPFERTNGIKKRLVHPRYLEIYGKIIIPGAKINLKTDDDTLYNYALTIVKENNLILHKAADNLYDGTPLTFEESILTKYEKNHIKEGKKIKLVSFSLR